MTVLKRLSRIYAQVSYDLEADFSNVVKAELSEMLPAFSVLEFSPFILGEEGSRRRPDLAIVHRDYSMWIVVEVELDSHPLQSHVIPQVRTFATGNYDSSHADFLHAKDPTLDKDKLRNLTMYHPPTISVVVNSRSVLEDGWDVLELDYSARLTFFESFRARNGDVIFSVSGYLPTPPPAGIIKFKKQEMMNALTCTRPADFPADVIHEVEMQWGGSLRKLTVMRTKDEVLLLPQGGITFRDDRNYEVRRNESQKYELHQC